MPTEKLPLFRPVWKNADGIELTDGNAELISGYVNELGATLRQPGTASIVNVNSSATIGVDGVYWWQNQSAVIVVHGGSIYKVTQSAGVYSTTNLTGTGTLLTGQPVSFSIGYVSTTEYLLMANGGRIIYTDGTTTTAYIADTSAPTQVTHLAYIDGYVLANSVGTMRFYYCANLSCLTWSGAGTGSAQAIGGPDLLTALYVQNREIYLFGPQSIEVWEDDGTTPFLRLPGGYIEVGCAAPYSPITTENGIFWLDSRRRIARFSGRSVDYIATPYDKVIRNMSNVSDCVGMRMNHDGQDLLIWTFAQAQKTIVANMTSNSWSEFGKYESQQMSYNRWLGNCHCYAINWGMNIIGSRRDAKILEVNSSYQADESDIIRMSRTTGHIDHGTSRMKRNKELRIRLKRGNTAVNDPKLMIRWRDDNSNIWSEEQTISLGNEGEYELFQPIQRTGIYRTRQYQISATDAVPIVYAEAEEDFDLLSR